MLPIVAITIGETYSQQGAVTATAGGAAIDLTGWTGTAQVRTSAGALVGAFTIAIDAGTAGTFLISATAAVTALWSAGDHVADLRFVGAGGEVTLSPPFIVRVTAPITGA